MPACYVPVCLKEKHNARKAVWFTMTTVHWSNFCIFVDRIDSHISESKLAHLIDFLQVCYRMCQSVHAIQSVYMKTLGTFHL